MNNFATALSINWLINETMDWFQSINQSIYCVLTMPCWILISIWSVFEAFGFAHEWFSRMEGILHDDWFISVNLGFSCDVLKEPWKGAEKSYCCACYITPFHTNVECRQRAKIFNKRFQSFSNFHYHIWIYHEKRTMCWTSTRLVYLC